MKKHISALVLAAALALTAVLVLTSCGKEQPPPPDSYAFGSYPILATTYEDVTEKLGEGTGAKIGGGYSTTAIIGTLYGKEAKMNFSFDSRGILLEESILYCEPDDTDTIKAIIDDFTDRFGMVTIDAPDYYYWTGVDNERISITAIPETSNKPLTKIILRRERDYYNS